MPIPRSYRQMPGTCIYICVNVYVCQGRRRCPRGPALSGPVRPVCPVRALWAQGTGADRTDRTGPDRAGTARWPSLGWPCPVRSGPSVRSVRSGLLGPGHWSGPDGPDRTGQGWHRALAKSSLALSGPVRSGPLQCRTPGPDGPDRTGRDPRSPHLFLFEKRLSVAPKQAFGQKVMECCSKTSFWTKSDGVLLQSNILP